jgi:tetratricopeptide (TPR) repeat protein
VVTRAKAAVAALSAEDFLQRALSAETAPLRARWAQKGLALDATDLDPDTQVLLLRQLYLAQLEDGQLRRAAEIAGQMAAIGPLRDIAHHDAARALEGLGERAEAIAAQRLAARHAPPNRRSFQLWSLATLHHHHGDVEMALRTLERAERWAHRDRPLIRAHAGYIRLAAGMAAPSLAKLVSDLQKSPAREGYGQWLLGMIAYELGDRRKAAAHLRAFLRRHAAADRAKAITLREELRRAQRALADLESE